VSVTSGATGGPARLILGTAQFAGDYGLLAGASPVSSNSDTDALAVLDAARHAGLCALDTAPAYGRAEEIIGASAWTGEVWTKLDPTLRPEESVVRSLSSLRRSRLDVIYVHGVSHVLKLDRRGLAEIKALRGPLVDAIGVSAYAPAEVISALSRLDFDVVQLPVNPLDTRLLWSLEGRLLPRECTYIGRSVFLQGLLAQPELASRRAPEGLRAPVRRWGLKCRTLNVAPGEAALAWALSLPFLSRVIVGADSPRQLQEVVSWSKSNRCSGMVGELPTENRWPLSDPRTWTTSIRPGKE
jgi:aryl-alcohol dehydrogenase-like predicted oxidoreductase